MADICFKPNIEETHIVNYALKKLVKAGLVEGRKHDQELLYETSEIGRALRLRYREIRNACIVDVFSALGEVDSKRLDDLAQK